MFHGGMAAYGFKPAMVLVNTSPSGETTTPEQCPEKLTTAFFKAFSTL